MITLQNLSDYSRPKKKVQRVGRGIGSHRGKTSGRGNTGFKSRSGYRRYFGYEGGQLPLYKKLPTRGFTNAMFKNTVFGLNLFQISKFFENGEEVSVSSLKEKGILPKSFNGTLKILAQGKLTKKVAIKAHGFSQSAQDQLTSAGVKFEIIGNSK